MTMKVGIVNLGNRTGDTLDVTLPNSDGEKRTLRRGEMAVTGMQKGRIEFEGHPSGEIDEFIDEPQVTVTDRPRRRQT